MTRTLRKPIVYCISEGLADAANITRTTREIIERIRKAPRCGVTLFQVREKRLNGRDLFELSREAAGAARESGIDLLVNGRPDIALAAGASGVHLPSDGLPPAEVRRCMPEDFLIGVSAHTANEVAAARDSGADLVTFGPVFESPGKGSGIGLDAFAEVCRAVHPFPVIALGGVDESRVNEVLAHGGSGYAAIRYLNDRLSNDP